MESGSDLVEYTYEALKSFTGEFSDKNLIGETMHIKVYRAKIPCGLETQEVVVKIWENFTHQLSSWKAEIKLLTKPDMQQHPNIVKLIGHCNENGQFGVVYEFNPLNTVEKLIHQDDFKWIARIKVAIVFACLIEFFHDKELFLHNIDAAHLMVDHGFNPMLFDFITLLGGEFGDIYSSKIGSGVPGNFDPYSRVPGKWSNKTDVFSYGVVLLGLISKRVYDINAKPLFVWAWEEYKKKPESKLCGMFRKHNSKSPVHNSFKSDPFFVAGDGVEINNSKSLVHNSFKSDPFFVAGDGVEITKLAMRCVKIHPTQRPTIKEVISCLRELNVVRCNVPMVGINPEMLSFGIGDDAI